VRMKRGFSRRAESFPGEKISPRATSNFPFKPKRFLPGDGEA
jgi:hypothetical protein